MTNENNWYAIFVLTGEEDKVKQRLDYCFEEEFRIAVPKRVLKERKGGVWREQTRTLFPSYVFINGLLDTTHYYKIKSVPGIVSLLGDKQSLLPIPPEEMMVLESLLYEDELIGYSDILINNKKVIVVSGPLTSLEGQIISVNKRKGRAKVQLSFLGELRTIELGVNLLEPINES